MGIGDWLMASGEAKESFERTGQRVAFVGPSGQVYWSEVFDGNPKIVRGQGPGITAIRQGGGVRPYIKFKTSRQWGWLPYKPIPGEIFFTDEELRFGERFRGRVIIEPNVKAVGHNNKDWGRQRWAELIQLLQKDVHLAQFVGPRSSPIAGVEQIGTQTFRQAAAVLRFSRAAVLPEGGLHHAAAAVGLRAVVIYGGFITPKSTGYDLHRNLSDSPQPHDMGCGMRIACVHCKQSMTRITPDRVARELRSIL